MLKNITRRSFFSGIIMLVLMAFIVEQGYFVWKDYAYIQLSYVKKYGLIESVARSAKLIFKLDSANYLRFLNLYIPPNAAVVLPPESEAGKAQQKWFSDQSMMQFYLLPRRIWSCDRDMNSDCIKSLTDPDSFVLALGEFPQPEYMEGKKLITFSGSIENIKGVYAPVEIASQLSVPSQETYMNLPGIPLSAPFIDAGIILAYMILGFIFVKLLVLQPTWIDILSLSFPLAIGLISWLTFLTSFLGIPITFFTIAFWFGVLFSTGIILHRMFHKSWLTLPQTNIIEPAWQAWKNDRTAFFLGLAVFLWFGLNGLISLGRGYSTFDDIVNWCLKGYAMADQNTIWASARWGGHAMAYPMNLQLSISTFRLADGDVIPGSKAIIPILTMCLLLGCYRFWRRQGVNIKFSMIGMLLIFTAPFFFWYSTLGFANSPFTAYLVLGILWSIEGLLNRDNRSILIGGILFAFAGWTRPEGMGYSLVMLVVIYLCAIIFMKINLSIQQIGASLLPTAIFPFTWFILIGAKAMREDQIGSVMSTFFDFLHGNINLDAWMEIVNYARYYFTSWRAAGFAIPISIIILIIVLPLSRWFAKPLQLSLFFVVLTAALVPAAMFFINSFSESDFVVFLDVSFNRAYLPTVVLFVIISILILGTSLSHRKVE